MGSTDARAALWTGRLAGTGAGDVADISWAPTVREIADVELILDGALPPLVGLPGRVDVESIRAGGVLADGTPCAAAPTLAVPGGADAAGIGRGTVAVLTDDEGAPVAELAVSERWTDAGHDVLAGALTALAEPAHGVARSLRRPPAAVRAERPDGPLLGVVAYRPLLTADIEALIAEAGRLRTSVLVLLTVGDVAGRIPTAVTVRAVLAASALLPDSARIVAVPLSDAPNQHAVAAQVARAYGITHLLTAEPADLAGIDGVVGGATDTDHQTLVGHLDEGSEIPQSLAPQAVSAALRRARPPRHRRGLTVFFTGLSGSGKSTVARALADALEARDERTVSLLDGDVVRRLLSAGLSFSRADRDLNIRRIGYVAAEITRHGGIAICAPIAPYAATRAQVRDMVSSVGDFLLVHICTPLAVCEQRDRKGLYAKARAGLIPEFTGVSDPYEEPADADLTIDTSTVSPGDAVALLLGRLESGGWLRSATSQNGRHR